MYRVYQYCQHKNNNVLQPYRWKRRLLLKQTNIFIHTQTNVQLEHRTGVNRETGVRGNLQLFRNLGTFIHPTLPVPEDILN